MDQIFGGEMPTMVRFVVAFGVVLSLIVLTFVGLRRFAGRRLPLSNAGRARQPRLGVLDAFAIDARRRLVLIRRDNVEHLIMIGGPNDVLVESEIVRAPAQGAIAPQRAQRTPGENTRAAVAPPERGVARALPPPEPMQAQIQQQMPEAPPVTPAAFRNAFPPRPAPRPAAPPPAPAASAPPPRAPVRAPQRQPEMMAEHAEAAAPAMARPKAEIDPLYADIERKLGEALSRPASSPPTPPAPTRSAPPPPPRASAPPPPPPRASAPPPPPPAARRAPEAPAPRAASKNHLDALEEEMASLLGRDRAT